MNKFFNLFKNKYVTYSLLVFVYLVGIVGANLLDSILVDAGECFSVVWNIIAAWSIIRFYQKKWIVQLDRTRFFNLYLLLGLLTIFINFLRYLGPADWHSPGYRYIIAFIVAFGTAFAEETVFRAYSCEKFKSSDGTFKGYKIVIIVAVYVVFTFFKEFLSSYFINLVSQTTDADSLLSQSIFWKPIVNATIMAACFGFFLSAIYRKTNLSTCVIISVGYYLIQNFTVLTASATYLPETVSNALFFTNLVIMVSSGLFFTLYKKKLPQRIEYELKEEAKEPESSSEQESK